MEGSLLLVTGGAGYIGQHVVRALLDVGDRVVVLDDVSSGAGELLPDGVPLVVGSVDDPAALDEAFGHGVSGVVHLAALKSVEESVAHPLDYYRVNVEGTRYLLEAMARHRVRQLVYSSSAAVYGDVAGGTLIDEDAPTIPVNPYGETKLIGEWLVRDAARASDLSWVALRYFNVAGAGPPELADRGVSNLVPAVIREAAQGRPPVVFGNDYPTPDGTCVRDYVHVVDLAEAHLAALSWVELGDAAGVYNVGTGRGASVLEVVASLSSAMGREVVPAIGPRRAGDPASVVADTRRISQDLGWRARFGIDEIVTSAWAAAAARPANG